MSELHCKAWAFILYDLEKFYDSVCLAILLGQAMKQYYPPTLLYLLFLCYTGPGVIREGRCVAEPLHPSDSIVAGCGEAGNIAKCMVYDLVEKWHQGRCKNPSEIEEESLAIFVDDVQHFAEGSSDESLVLKIVASAQKLVKEIKDNHLKVSPITTVVASGEKSCEVHSGDPRGGRGVGEDSEAGN